MVKKIGIFFFSLLVITGCAQHLSSQTFVVFGTYLTVKSTSPRAAEIVYKEFRRMDGVFNPYKEGSDVTRVNESHGEAVTVSKEFIEVLTFARDIYQKTQGNFDITKGLLYRFWKQKIKEGEYLVSFPKDEEITPFLKSSGMNAIIIDEGSSTVRITQPGVSLDLSGIAKGYVVDRAAAALRRQGITSAIIDAGGDIYCMGTNHGELWKVGIRNPFVPNGIVKTVTVNDAAVATSGNYEQFFEYQGKKYSHLIDPHSGFPVQNTLNSVTIIADTCMRADAYATAFFIMGEEKVKEFLCQYHLNMKVYFIKGDKQTYELIEL